MCNDTKTFEYDFNKSEQVYDMTNKLFCTFTVEEELPVLLETIESKYNIMYNKICLLYTSPSPRD